MEARRAEGRGSTRDRRQRREGMRANQPPRVRVCDMGGIPDGVPGGLMRHRCGRHDEGAPSCTVWPCRPRCGESPPDIVRVPWLEAVEGEARHPGSVCRAPEGRRLQLANILLGPIRDAPRPPPVWPHDGRGCFCRGAGRWTRPTWIQGVQPAPFPFLPRGPCGADRAAGMRGGGEEGRAEPVRRVTQFDGRPARPGRPGLGRGVTEVRWDVVVRVYACGLAVDCDSFRGTLFTFVSQLCGHVRSGALVLVSYALPGSLLTSFGFLCSRFGCCGEAYVVPVLMVFENSLRVWWVRGWCRRGSKRRCASPWEG